MRNRDPMRPRRAAAVGAVLLALALGLSGVFMSAGHAFAEEDEEDVPLDTKIFRQFMKDLGLRRDDDSVGNIEYRERSPLVLPPSRNLPPPEDEAKVANSPAWPKDPDVNRRKRQAAAEKAKLKSQTEIFEEEKDPLRAGELTRLGRKANETKQTAPGANAEDALNPMTPGQLGSKNLFGTLFSKIGPEKQEIAPFTGEPPRSSMTAPPPGYQTPSPNQPYGLGPEKWVNKPQTVEQRHEAPR